MRNRRATTRHPASEFRVWLGLWVRPDHFEALAARIENISVGGARIVTASAPSPSQKVWLRMGTPACMDCVQATVLEVEERDEGDFAARLAFDSPCPSRLLKTAVQGIAPRPHFRMTPAAGSREPEIAPPRELTHREQSPIIPRLLSRSRTSV